MVRIARSVTILFAATVFASCDLPRTSQQVCECLYLKGKPQGLYTKLPQAPSHFNEIEFWDEWLAGISDPEYVSAFRNGTTHWYKDLAGAAHWCRVVDGSDQMNAYVVISSDRSLSEPLDARTLEPIERPPPNVLEELLG